jgi:hypothetical protein
VPGAASRAYYVTTIDRAGLALGAGGALSGVVATLLVAAGGHASLSALVVGWLVGAIVAMCAIVAVAGPLWLVLHLTNRRGPWTAALTGGAIALLLFSAGQMGGVGMFGAPAIDGAALAYRLLSAVATSMVVALAAAAIGWVMQRIAYRRIF